MWKSIAFPMIPWTCNKEFRFLGDLPPAPFLPTAWRTRGLPRLHRALQEAIPALATGLVKSDSDYCYSQFMLSTSFEDRRYWYQETNLLKRYLGSEALPADERSSAAVEKLLAANDRCKWTNDVFRTYGSSRDEGGLPPQIVRVLKRAESRIRRLLGRFDLEELYSACNFTPGATTEYPRKLGALHNKWATASHVTFHAKPYAEGFVAWANMAGLQPEFVIDNFNSVFTVPKDTWCDRAAARPVTWNGFLQKGIGKMLRRRANRVGLLRPNAQEEHRLLAKLGSATMVLSARDLKSASDTLALFLCASVIPPDWMNVLDHLREPLGVTPAGEIVDWEFLSTMGNGYTFEVETLVFWAIVSACCGKESLVSVYGDDIIFPEKYSEVVDEVLSFCGFEVNGLKSSRKGVPFMESCGGHYYQGRSIKPMYLQRMPTSLGDVINLHNDIVRISDGRPAPTSRWFKVWSECRSVVPKKFWGPTGIQGVLWAEFDETCPGYNPWVQAHYVLSVSRAKASETDLHAHIGAYLQKLWELGGDTASETSVYRETGEQERGAWIYVYRQSWPLMCHVGKLCD